MTQPIHQSTKRVAGRQGKKTAQGKTAQGKTPVKLLVAMTGKASAAKTAKGDKPVFAYIASLPQPQRGIAERIDALAAKSLPDIQRAVKWGMAYYGVDGGWCFSSGAFVGHGDAVIRQGRRRRVHLAAVSPEQRAPILREYVRIALSGRQHFPLSVAAPLADFEAIARRYPVYRIDPS